MSGLTHCLFHLNEVFEMSCSMHIWSRTSVDHEQYTFFENISYYIYTTFHKFSKSGRKWKKIYGIGWIRTTIMSWTCMTRLAIMLLSYHTSRYQPFQLTSKYSRKHFKIYLKIYIVNLQWYFWVKRSEKRIVVMNLE